MGGLFTMLIPRRSCIFGSIFSLVASLSASSLSCSFVITNNCPYTIWPGTLANAGILQLARTGFQLDSGRSASVATPPGWSGRVWARTGCEFDPSGIGQCETGDCGGRLQCDGLGGTPPLTLFEISLGQGDAMDFYDVSLVDGYNLPVVAEPRGVYGECNVTGCALDVNLGCPKELQVMHGDTMEGGGVIACKSACDAFLLDQYCCKGQFESPTTCQPSYYSAIFKRACPLAYSYGFDDRTSTFTCKASEYAIIFCPGENEMGNDKTQPIPEYNKGNHVTVTSTSSVLVVPVTIISMLILCTYAVL